MNDNVTKAVGILGQKLGEAQARGELSFDDEMFSVAIGPMLSMGERIVQHNLMFNSDPETLAQVAYVLVKKQNDDFGSEEDEVPKTDVPLWLELSPMPET